MGKLTDEQKKEIITLVPKMAFREIAQLYNVKLSVIEYYLLKVRPPEGWGLRSKRQRKLTEEEIAQAIGRRSNGETLKAIAASYHVSEPAIHKIVKHIKPLPTIRRRDSRLTNDQIEEAIARRRSGESLKAIATSYEVSTTVIHRVTKRATPPEGWKYGKLTKAQKSEAVARRMNGEKLDTIAESYGVTSSYIHQITKKAESI